MDGPSLGGTSTFCFFFFGRVTTDLGRVSWSTGFSVAPMKLEEEVVVHKRSQIGRLYPDDSEPSYEFRELARTKHQPDVKGLDVSVIGNGRSEIRHGLHEYIYNYGEAPVTMYWGNNRPAMLAPGDSAYVKPLIKHSFEKTDHLVLRRMPVRPDAITRFSVCF